MEVWRYSLSGGVLVLASGAVLLLAAWFWRARLYRYLFHSMTTSRQLGFFEAFPVKQGDVVFLGDSLTSQGRWGELFPGVPARNRGISGDTTTDVLSRLEEVTRSSPSQIFLMIGTNDLGLGLPAERVLQNVATIVAEIGRASPNTELYLQTLLPRQATYAGRIRQVNDGLAQVAERAGVMLVDVGCEMSSPDGVLRPELTHDQLHLLGAGYKVWKKVLDPLVKKPDAVPGGVPVKGG